MSPQFKSKRTALWTGVTARYGTVPTVASRPTKMDIGHSLYQEELTDRTHHSQLGTVRRAATSS